MNAPQSSLRIAVQSYSDLGLSVIPVKPRSKIPSLTRWQQYQSRRPTDKELDDWFSKPQNVAVVCGAISGGLIVIDFDDPRAFAYCFPDHLELARKTLVVETGRGVHVYVRLKGGGKPKSTTYRRRGKERSWLPVDVQAEGKYAICPPSVHESGKSYRFIGDGSAVLEAQSESALHADLSQRAEEWPFVEVVLSAWTESTRHNLALGFAKILRFKAGFAPERVEDIVHRVCSVLGDPEERDRIRAVRDTIAKGPEETAGRTWLGDELYERLSSLVPRRRKPESTEGAGEREPAEHAKFVKEIMDEHTFATMNDTDEIFVYENGAYRPGAEAILRSEVETRRSEEDDSATKRLADEVVDAVRRRTYVPRKDFNPLGRLCLANGVLDLTTLTVSPHAENDRFTTQLSVSYDPEATCPLFLRFLEEIQPDAEVRRDVQRLFGYCLEGGNPYQTAFMLVGPGENGRSTLLGVLADFLGRDNVATETLQTLSENRFAAGRLWDRLANICADIPANAIRYTGTFKMLTGGDLMRGEEKYRRAFDFVNPAKLIFSANEFPQISDRTFAFWRRWRLYPFNVPITKPDRGLPSKLRTELSGILNWAIVGLRDLRASDGFPAGGAVGALKEEWMRHADSLYWFLGESIEIDAKSTISKDDFYEAYVSFCEANGARPKTRDRVGADLRDLVPSIRQERPRREGGPRVWMWVGIRWRPDARDTLDLPGQPGPLGPEGRQDVLDTGSGQGGPSGQGTSNSFHAEWGSQSTPVTDGEPPHPDRMFGIEFALNAVRVHPSIPVTFCYEDALAAYRAQFNKDPDPDQLRAGVIKALKDAQEARA